MEPLSERAREVLAQSFAQARVPSYLQEQAT
jgi:hypothetical protein